MMKADEKKKEETTLRKIKLSRDLKRLLFTSSWHHCHPRSVSDILTKFHCGASHFSRTILAALVARCSGDVVVCTDEWSIIIDQSSRNNYTVNKERDNDQKLRNNTMKTKETKKEEEEENDEDEKKDITLLELTSILESIYECQELKEYITTSLDITVIEYRFTFMNASTQQQYLVTFLDPFRLDYNPFESTSTLDPYKPMIRKNISLVFLNLVSYLWPKAILANTLLSNLFSICLEDNAK